MRIPTGKLGSDRVAKRDGKGGVSHIVLAMVHVLFQSLLRPLCAAGVGSGGRRKDDKHRTPKKQNLVCR